MALERSVRSSTSYAKDHLRTKTVITVVPHMCPAVITYPWHQLKSLQHVKLHALNNDCGMHLYASKASKKLNFSFEMYKSWWSLGKYYSNCGSTESSKNGEPCRDIHTVKLMNLGVMWHDISKSHITKFPSVSASNQNPGWKPASAFASFARLWPYVTVRTKGKILSSAVKKLQVDISYCNSTLIDRLLFAKTCKKQKKKAKGWSDCDWP